MLEKTLINDLTFHMPQHTSSEVTVGERVEPNSDNCEKQIIYRPIKGPDYRSRAGPVSQVASVCRDDFLPGIT